MRSSAARATEVIVPTLSGVGSSRLLSPRPCGHRRRWSTMRRFIQPILYVLQSGHPWRTLPVSFPPPVALYVWFSELPDAGAFESPSE